jgi:predicted Zn-dependent protease
VHLLQSRTKEAIVWFEKARSANPRSQFPHTLLASAYALKGYLDHARAELAEARRLEGGNDVYSSIARMRAIGYWGVPKVRALFEATFFAGLRKAGVPEE